MPSSPEICNGICNIRIVEILRKVKTEHSAKTDGHPAVSCKIKINLECICQCGNPEDTGTSIFVITENRIRDDSHIVGNNDFCSKPCNELFKSFCEIFERFLTFVNFIFNICITDNRSCYKLWKECNIQHEIKEIFLSMGFSPVYVNNVRKSLKCIKTDPNWQR